MYSTCLCAVQVCKSFPNFASMWAGCGRLTRIRKSECVRLLQDSTEISECFDSVSDQVMFRPTLIGRPSLERLRWRAGVCALIRGPGSFPQSHYYQQFNNITSRSVTRTISHKNSHHVSIPVRSLLFASVPTRKLADPQAVGPSMDSSMDLRHQDNEALIFARFIFNKPWPDHGRHR
jgi:hypothetical protein